MNIVTIGIDLAKNAFAVHCVNATGAPALMRPKQSRFVRRFQNQRFRPFLAKTDRSDAQAPASGCFRADFC